MLKTIDLTPEQETVLAALRVDHARDYRLRDLLRGPLDWDALRDFALRHGVMPLVYTRMAELRAEMSEGVREGESEREENSVFRSLTPSLPPSFRQLFLSNARRNLMLAEHLLALLRMLDGAGIQAVPIKGPALAVQAYGDVALRQMCDLDLLIHREDFRRVYDLMVGAGYTPDYPVTRAREALLFKGSKELSFHGRRETCRPVMLSKAKHLHVDEEALRSARGGAAGKEEILRSAQDDMGSAQDGIRRAAPVGSVDVEWELVGPYARVLPSRLDHSGFWTRLGSVSLNGEEVPVLSPEDTLLVLCVHGAGHAWGQLKWVADVAYLVTSHPNLDWAAVAERATTAGARDLVALGLQLAQEIGGAVVPPAARAFFPSGDAVRNLADRVRLSLVEGAGDSRLFVTTAVSLGGSGASLARLRYLLGLAFVPKRDDWMSVSLPDALYPLYHLIRPLRLLRDLGPKALRHRLGLRTVDRLLSRVMGNQ